MKYSYWLSSGKYAMMQKLTTISLGILGFMMIARLFNPGVFGVWGLFIITASIVETTRNALIKNGYIVFKSIKDPVFINAIESASILLNTLFTSILLILFFVFGFIIESAFRAPGLSGVLSYYSLALLFLIPYSQTEIFLYSKMNFKAIFCMYLTRNGLFTTSVAFIYFMGVNISLEKLALIYMVCIIPGWLIGLLFSRRYDRIVFQWNKKIFLGLLGFGKYVFGNNLFSLVFVNTDTFMTSRLISTSISTFYNIGSRVLNFADIPSQVLGDIMFPRAAQIVKSGNDVDIKRIYEKTVAATLCFVIPFTVFGFIFSGFIITVLGGKQYLAASAILRIMLFYSLFLPFIKQFGNIMDAKGKPYVNFWVMMCFSAINIGINFFSISRFGITGAAYGSLTSYFLLFITTQYILYRLVNVSTFNILKNILYLYPEYFIVIRRILKLSK